MLRLFRFTLFLLFVECFASSVLGDGLGRRRWAAQSGDSLRSELVEVWGPWAFFQDRERFGHFTVTSFVPEDQALIEGFAAEQMAARGAPWSSVEGDFWTRLEKRLFRVKDGARIPFETPGVPEPDFYVFFFGAHFSGPAWDFAPKLTAAHREWTEAGFRNYQIFFLSWDEKAAKQLEFAQHTWMPFPLLELDSDKILPELRRVRPADVPALVVTDHDGHTLYHSYQGGESRGCEIVLEELEGLLYLSNPDLPVVREARFAEAKRRYLEGVAADARLAPRLFEGPLPGEFFERLGVDGFKAELIVDASGRIESVEWAEAPSPSALAYLRGVLRDWRFIPTVVDGAYTSARVVAPFRRSGAGS